MAKTNCYINLPFHRIAASVLDSEGLILDRRDEHMRLNDKWERRFFDG
jgi:hypothetical protein